MQSKNIDTFESCLNRIPKKVSKHQREVDPEVLKPESSYSKGAYEATQARHTQYYTKGDR
jgi:hypothetical protein